MVLPLIRNPNFSGQPVIVGGVEVITTESEQLSGVDAPTKSMERGAEISQRNVLHPDSGTITGAVDGAGLSALQGLTRQREPISITTPESTISNCVVEEVTRTREGRHVSKFGVSIAWRQVLIAEIGSVTITAVTGDGKKSQGASDSSSVSLAGSKSTSSAQSGDGGGGQSIGGYLGGLVGDAWGLVRDHH